jgi:transaldolase
MAAAGAFLRGVEAASCRLKPISVPCGVRQPLGCCDRRRMSAPEKDQLGIAIAPHLRPAALPTSPQCHALQQHGPQRLLWASTGTKDPQASDILYIKALAAPVTVNAMPESTLKALGDSDGLSEIMPLDGGNCEEVLARFVELGIDLEALAAQLQEEGEKLFVNSWNDLMAVITSKSAILWKKV